MFLPPIHSVTLGKFLHVPKTYPLYWKNGTAIVPISQDSRGLNKLVYLPGMWQEQNKDVRAVINTTVIIITGCQF